MSGPVAVILGWDDIPHLSDVSKAELERSYAPHERQARTKGVPQLGSGAIYPVDEREFAVDPIELPDWYQFSFGLDVGWNRTAAVWSALDPESDVLYLYSEYYRGQAEPAIHAQAILARGRWIPGVIDPAARGRAQHDGQQLLAGYVRLGLDTLTIADNAVEAGIYAVWSRLSSGRLKVFKTCQDWLTEFRMYRRDEKGRVVKEADHLMDATRYNVMSGIDRAIQKPPEQWRAPRGGLHKFDHDPFQEAFAAGSGIQGRPQSNPYDNRPGWIPGRYS